jgi:outer membrane protein
MRVEDMLSRCASSAGIATLVALGVIGSGAVHAAALPSTLQEALAAAYANNPTLLAFRAQLRATDENVPGALAGWRPQLVFTGQAGIGAGKNKTINKDELGDVFKSDSSADRGITVANIGLTQPIYSGGKVKASTSRAENQVLSTRAQLMATEQQVFSDTISAYVNVVQDEQILQYDISNEQILTKQLQATNDRFRVGELTRTDVAQSEAALASATATRQTAEGTLESARATYEQLVGEPPGKLIEPQPLRSPVKSLEEAKELSQRNNPNVVAALFADSAARDAFDVAYSALLPTLNVQASAFRTENQLSPGLISTGGQVLANLTVPIYQGGSEYASIRQARQQEQQARQQLDEQRRTAVQQATSAWEQVASARAAIISERAAVRANQISVEGLEREALVGSATTLDVLTGVQNLLNSETALVQALAQLVNASYQVAAAAGRLTARDLNLQVPMYDEKAYYTAVHDLWIGTGDYATGQPGR